MPDVSQHNEEIQRNLRSWEHKPLLKQIYRGFHELIAEHLSPDQKGSTVELGSGIGNIKEAIPNCIRTDLFRNPWIDQVENAYRLSFTDASVSNLILFDVFHHLRYPGTALKEFERVLRPSGRLLVFDPCVSLLGRLVYGPLHAEPLGLDTKIDWCAPEGWSPEAIDYYAAQGNASRVFLGGYFEAQLEAWNLLAIIRRAAISYVASGGYSGPQLYPLFALPLMKGIDAICDLMPAMFATRLLAVLEKKGPPRPVDVS